MSLLQEAAEAERNYQALGRTLLAAVMASLLERSLMFDRPKSRRQSCRRPTTPRPALPPRGASLKKRVESWVLWGNATRPVSTRVSASRFATRLDLDRSERDP